MSTVSFERPIILYMYIVLILAVCAVLCAYSPANHYVDGQKSNAIFVSIILDAVSDKKMTCLVTGVLS